MDGKAGRLLCAVAGGLLGLGSACTGDIDAMSDPGAPGGSPEPGTPGTPPRPGAPGGSGGSGGTTPTAPIPPGMRPASCQAASPGPSPLRRLTHREYDNTVRALLGLDLTPSTDFPAEEDVLGFDNSAEARGIGAVLSEGYLEAAEQLAGLAIKNMPKLVGCDAAALAAAPGRDNCVKQWIAGFGRRAFRRPLDAAENTRFFQTYSTGRDKWSFEVGVQLALEAFLLSPHFLYRVEGMTAAAAGATVVAVNDWEMAARLSYFLWAGPPDDELMRAAEGKQLTTAAQVQAQARRMLADPRARALVTEFHNQWLDLNKVEEMDKDPAAFKSFTAELRPLLRQETEAFVDQIVWNGNGDFKTLLTAPFSMMNAKLAAFYGASGPTTTKFEMIPVDRSQRAGVLTHAGLLAANAHAKDTSPVHRGLFVRRNLLCTPPPPPPEGISFNPPAPDAKVTTRERFKRHQADPSCAGCHMLMDDVGLAFESYDAVGLWRATENGLPIDVSGRMVGTDVPGDFKGAIELGAKLASSKDAARCMTTQWFRFAFGREEGESDACSQRRLEDVFVAGKQDIRELVVAITQTDAFLYRTVSAGGAP